MSTRLWITWEEQRRNKELSKALVAEFVELKEIDQIQGHLKKYGTGVFKTIRILLDKRPTLVFCQNPSIVLALLLLLLRTIFRFRLVVDAHNAGIFPTEGKSSFLMQVSRFIQKRADLVLVTNEGLKNYVEHNNGKAFVLPDRIPNIPRQQAVQLAGRINFLFICSYADDEPYEMVFQAAQKLPADLAIYVTGNYRKKDLQPADLPQQVHLTGFVSMEEFECLLHSIDATIDLTDREDCLVCGAYESVAVEKPMILSDTKALRQYFDQGAIYSAHTPETIYKAIIQMAREKDILGQQVKELKKRRVDNWQKRLESLEDILLRICPEGLVK